MGQSASRVALQGNDGAGKTFTLYRAVLGEQASKTTVSTIGVNDELVRVPDVNFSLDVFDAGGGIKAGGLFLNQAQGCQALVFVVRATDGRLWSALWELHSALCANASVMLPVCVAVIRDEAFPTKIGSGGGDEIGEGDKGERWPHIVRMAARECLPPGLTERWSEPRRIGSPAAAAAKPPCSEEGAPADERARPSPDDEVWLSDWEHDRRAVTAAGCTQSHGMPVSDGSERWLKGQHGARPIGEPLSSWHKGPWVVLPIDPVHNAEDALKPFRWVSNALRELQAQGYPQAFPSH